MVVTASFIDNTGPLILMNDVFRTYPVTFNTLKHRKSVPVFKKITTQEMSETNCRAWFSYSKQRCRKKIC